MGWSVVELINMDAIVSSQWSDTTMEVGRPDVQLMTRELRQLTRGMKCIGTWILFNSFVYLCMCIYTFILLSPDTFNKEKSEEWPEMKV